MINAGADGDSFKSSQTRDYSCLSDWDTEFSLLTWSTTILITVTSSKELILAPDPGLSVRYTRPYQVRTAEGPTYLLRYIYCS